MEQVEKVFLSPGDVVTLKQEILNSPYMLVTGKLNSEGGLLIGMKCIWFSEDKKLQMGVFSTKDLIKI